MQNITEIKSTNPKHKQNASFDFWILNISSIFASFPFCSFEDSAPSSKELVQKSSDSYENFVCEGVLRGGHEGDGEGHVTFGVILPHEGLGVNEKQRNKNIQNLTFFDFVTF